MKSIGGLGYVLNACKNQGIKTLVLKGALLAEQVYPHFCLRYFSDIDLLFQEQNLIRVAELTCPQ